LTMGRSQSPPGTEIDWQIEAYWSATVNNIILGKIGFYFL
jgi:hypothetical protein